MASLDTLPADQRAVLQLVLARGRSFEEIAQMLSIDRAAVRERALAALDALGPQTQVPPERRALITDYLLGQLPPKVAELTRSRLASSAPDRAWARVLAAELAPLAAAPLPEIPAAADEAPAAAADEAPAAAGGAAPAQGEEDELPAAAPAAAGATPAAAGATLAAAGAALAAAEAAAPPERNRGAASQPAPPSHYGRPDRQQPRRSSRRGGAIVLGVGALVAIAVVVIVVVLVAGSGGSHHRTTARKTTSRAATTPAGSAKAQVVSRITLTSPTSKSTRGAAEVVREGKQLGLVLVAVGVPANSAHNAYAVWLSNGPNDSVRLGFVNPGVKSNGQLRAAATLPSNASRYKELLVTLETTGNPKVPGKIVLEGPLGLSS
jgi:hypothetical protein